MFFSRIELMREAISVRDIVHLLSGEGYQAHRQIWSLFGDGPERKRDFLYRHEISQGWPRFYSVSERAPIDSSARWNIESRPYTPTLRAGQRLAFTLRANPVRARRDEEGRQHRHDVVMEAKRRLKEKEMARGNGKTLAALVQEEGARWLSERAEKRGFAVDPHHIRVDGYRQHRLSKGRGGMTISFSTLDFNGILTVTDPERFIQTLYKGIGPAKGFGCGMIMVRRV